MLRANYVMKHLTVTHYCKVGHIQTKFEMTSLMMTLLYSVEKMNSYLVQNTSNILNDYLKILEKFKFCSSFKDDFINNDIIILVSGKYKTLGI